MKLLLALGDPHAAVGAAADAAHAATPVPGIATITPFALLLLAVALFPLIRQTHHWWEHNSSKLLVASVLGAITLVYYWLRGFGYHHSEAGLPAVAKVLEHAVLHEYVPFLTLLFSLYVVAGGIAVRGDLRATPLVNTTILAIGTLLASFIGTTGASMLLIRALLKTNRERRHVVHTVVFFIFMVSNIGGTLLPLGDPPLFLGYLRGVPFFWTTNLFLPWITVVALLLPLYFAIDTYYCRRERAADIARDVQQIEPLRVGGLINIFWMLGVVVAVATLDVNKPIPGLGVKPYPYVRELVQIGFALLSLATTPRGIRSENQFNYAAIGEVACLFIGIFITMQTPIEILNAYGASLGVTQPWQFFWATGALSSFLDNAPTYVVFFETAKTLQHGPAPGALQLLDGSWIDSQLLVAISLGAVFMGANTYIGNGPNFMVKSIAEQSGVRMPSFFGYMAYSGLLLLPVFVVVTLLFMR